MRFRDRVYLSLAVLITTVGPALAQRRPNGGHHSTPEIDASAGVATLAVLATAAVIAYTRSKR